MAEKVSVIDKWFDAIVTNDEDRQFWQNVGAIAFKKIENLKLGVKSHKTIAFMYESVFLSIMELIRSKEEEYQKYNIDLIHMNIGYTTTNDDDDEKKGNFMVYIQHKDHKLTEQEDNDPNKKTIELCREWISTNIKDGIEEANIIGSTAIINMAKNGNLAITSDLSSMPIPFFIYVHEAIIEYLKTRRIEMDQDKIVQDILGLFKIIIEMDGDAELLISYAPDGVCKLLTKNDDLASSEED